MMAGEAPPPATGWCSPVAIVPSVGWQSAGSQAGRPCTCSHLGGDTIAGDFLGIDPTGTGPNPDQVGVQVETANNTIGGVAPADRDVVSANTLAEVYLLGTGAIANTVAGDFVGTNLAGTASLSNPGGGDGVAIDFGASGNTVGGTTAGARNVLSGNGASGVRIDGGTFSDLSTGNETVQGNLIGTDASGTVDIGNGADGVAISRRLRQHHWRNDTRSRQHHRLQRHERRRCL